MVTRRSSSSSMTSNSPGRFSNRRRLSVPVPSTTASDSIVMTLPIRQEDALAHGHFGDQTRRRVGPIRLPEARATASPYPPDLISVGDRRP